MISHQTLPFLATPNFSACALRTRLTCDDLCIRRREDRVVELSSVERTFYDVLRNDLRQVLCAVRLPACLPACLPA